MIGNLELVELSEKEIKLIKKLQKKFPEFIQEVEHLNKEQLERRILETAKNLEEIEKAKDQDQELNDVISRKKDLEAPYNENLKIGKDKNRLLCMLVKKKG